MTMASEGASDTIRSEFVTGLRNAHALEKQARQLIERQLERLESYPEVAQALRSHLQETNQQEERIDQLLARFDESRSVIKDAAMQFTANLGAMMHATADDEILKNTFANLAFENFEIASYKSLIAMAKAGGFTQEAQVLEQSLREEQQMASWIDQNVATVTTKYLQLKASGSRADR
ncbi:ferritin-like domain-containing protein [Alsobacter sp. KACC 23698]|uniref:Ferritin-like domain-containing protein n=1 Tax=Alsobacter sp. KACC 23698 TaxID=3149229 RepID=A0AAU7JB91_9HYPH